MLAEESITIPSPLLLVTSMRHLLEQRFLLKGDLSEAAHVQLSDLGGGAPEQPAEHGVRDIRSGGLAGDEPAPLQLEEVVDLRLGEQLHHATLLL